MEQNLNLRKLKNIDKVKGGRSVVKEKNKHIYGIARAFWKILLKMKMLQHTLCAKIKTIKSIDML